MPQLIQPTDLISGAQYLKLLNDYKAYDKEQKKVIRKLQDKVNYLTKKDPELMKYMQRKELFHQLGQTIHKLRQDNEELIIRIAQLEQRLAELTHK